MPSEKLSPPILLRMLYIDVWLAFNGLLNRQPLMAYFGISMTQASRDIRDYMKLAPDNVIYDKSKKHYLRSSRFKRLYS